MISAMIAGGLQLAGGFASSRKAKKQAKKLRDAQINQANIEFNMNRDIANEDFIHNTVANFFNISTQMGEATSEYVNLLSTAQFNNYDMGGGTAYNSARKGVETDVTQQYLWGMADALAYRGMQENELINDYNNTMWQLRQQRANAIAGIQNSYSNSMLQIRNNQMSNSISALSNFFNSMSQYGSSMASKGGGA